MTEEEFYEPKRPKPQFDMKWLLIGFVIMVGLRGTVQLYIELSKVRVKNLGKTDSSKDANSEKRMEEANKRVKAATERVNKVNGEISKVNQRISTLAAKTKLTAQETRQKASDEKLLESMNKRRDNATEELTKANGKVAELLGEKVSEGLDNLGSAAGAGIGIMVAYIIFAPFTYFLGGLIVGWKSPGNTIMEPALAAIGATVVITSWDFIGGVGEGQMACLGCSAIFSFLIALVGAMIGEKIQGPAVAEVNVNLSK